ncbi:uncharacterized protein LOC124114897 [Haliotis rufescens]|uniref:uncharacterized protein LOC124114897 n=1 Tax=Haliotis rufescens TaxID=6454 RepID=UPI00201E86C9|nr:uncharacterized protein LOC124114897 [Haliotis rufescens]
MDMLARYWTVWTTALYICIATDRGITEARCNVHEFQLLDADYQGKKIDKTIRRRGTATSLLKCLSFCNKDIVSTPFYNQDTQDCICPLSRPRDWLLVSGPGYVFYDTPGLIDVQLQEAINASSEADGYPAQNVVGGHASPWKPRSDDAAPWIEAGIRQFLYFEEIRINPSFPTLTNGIWFRDSNMKWIKTWTKNDAASPTPSWFIPHCQVLSVPTDALRITMDQSSSFEIRFIRVAGRK